MNLKSYLAKQGISQQEFGRLIGVTQSLVSRWCKDSRYISAEKVVVIEQKTKGKIRRSDLRPDLWGKAA